MNGMEQPRQNMVTGQLVARGIRDAAVLKAMGQVPREEFVPGFLRSRAYDDTPLPIEEHQTISQPYVVALMLELLHASGADRCLEIGTGSRYAAAVLSRIAAVVHTVERHPVLARSAAERLRRLGYMNVHVTRGDGSLGLAGQAPFDGILFSAGAPDLPPSLLDQLSEGGRLVAPVGRSPYAQELVRVTRRGQADFVRENLGAVQFVPLVGAQGWAGPETKKP